MSGTKGHSGGAHGGSQYDPNNISATGGDGQSGQAKKYIPGMSSMGVTGKSVYEQQGGAPLYADRGPEPTPVPEVTPLTAPSEMPDQHVMHGSQLGPGATSVPGLPVSPTDDPDMVEIKNNLPLIEYWASQPGASQSTKDYAAYLKTIVVPPQQPRTPA